MSGTTTGELVNEIKGWIELDNKINTIKNDIKILNNSIKDKVTKKKLDIIKYNKRKQLITDKLIDVMNENKLDLMSNSDNTTMIIKKKKKKTETLNKQTIIKLLHQQLGDDKASETVNFLYDKNNRETTIEEIIEIKKK
jgi:hypothetical protein